MLVTPQAPSSVCLGDVERSPRIGELHWNQLTGAPSCWVDSVGLSSPIRAGTISFLFPTTSQQLHTSTAMMAVRSPLSILAYQDTSSPYAGSDHM